ncbi:bifunctional DNA primase/polymerase [Methanosarcina sp. UBA5]|uniref:bifunctional DNA primase/polymerase n=1 Tax=Methanosarcina sp. UBA5 TaxID=1915593 RepID=UPI0025DAB3FE|nr:bifunctional DNA primase/polymerase [Methanosarcina sp. UBA5]
MPEAEYNIMDSAKRYTGLGWIVHPLSSPYTNEKTAGKRPIERAWQERDNHRTEAEILNFWGPGAKEPFNIGLQCGKRSGVLVVDVDDWNPAIWQYLTEGLNVEDWLISRRTEGRAHLFFKYTPKLPSQKRHDLGIEMLSDGSNVVLPPSRHKTGSYYQFDREPMTPEDLPDMPDELIQRLNTLFTTNNKLKSTLGRCKPCLRDIFMEHQKNHNIRDWHGAEGRQLTIALLADMGANGADAEVMDLVCKYIFREQYDRDQTLKELSYIDAEKPWKCETIKTKLADITVTSGNPTASKCENCNFRNQNSMQKPDRQVEKDTEAKGEDPYNTDFDEKDIPPEIIKQAEEEAERILAEGNPIKYILDVIQKKHTGDQDTQEAIAISIACQSCLNTAGLQISVNGESGSGKSHGLKAHLHLIPRRWKRETSLSAKAAYYMGLTPGMILFSDDKDPDPDFEEVIKRAVTNFQQETVHTTVKDLALKRVVIPPRINWYLTSVESHVSDQLLNRQLTFDADSSLEQDNRVFELQKAEALLGGTLEEVTFEVLVCRRIYGKIKENLFKVKIPFVDNIDIRDKSNRRLFPMFLDMIRGYSIFKFKQRELDEEGYLLADIEDFKRAKRLFEMQKENVVSKLNAKETKIINYISQHEDCTIAGIADATGYPYSTVFRILKGRADKPGSSGLLGKVKGLIVVDMIITEAQANGDSKGRKAEHFRLKKSNIFDLLDSEFILLKEV